MASTAVGTANKEAAFYEGKPLREKRPKKLKKIGKSLRLRGMISDKAARRHLGEV
jgi:hypothetical protein